MTGLKNVYESESRSSDLLFPISQSQTVYIMSNDLEEDSSMSLKRKSSLSRTLEGYSFFY